MDYNKNIVLDILRSNFWDEIEIGIGFSFYEEEEEYFDIVLEHLY